MGKITRALKAGAKAAADHYSARTSRPLGEPIKIAGRRMVCPHCLGDRFESQKARLKSAFLPFGDSALLDETVTVVLCMKCSAIHWFAADADPVDE